MKKIILIGIIVCLISCQSSVAPRKIPDAMARNNTEWKISMSDMQYYVMRENGTEPPFSGTLDDFFEDGTYHCSACDHLLFDSGKKYDSNCGWPSFDQAIPESVKYLKDESHHMIRTEVRCKNCDSHLGHVFPDGPKETTGERYCINSVALTFKPLKK